MLTHVGVTGLGSFTEEILEYYTPARQVKFVALSVKNYNARKLWRQTEVKWTLIILKLAAEFFE